MHALLFALTLAAGGDLVLLDAPPTLAKQLRPVLAARGFEVVTTPGVHAALQSAASRLAHGALEEKAPRGIPPDVAAEWDQATAACRASAGLPFDATNAAAVRCGADIPEGLWVRFVDRRHATRVVEAVPAADGAVGLTLFAAAARDARSLHLAASEAAQVGAHLAGMLAGVEGSASLRPVTHYMLPVAPPGAVDPLEDEDDDDAGPAAFSVPEACKLPAKIVVHGKDATLARALEAHFARLVAAHTGPALPELSCTETLTAHEDKLMGLMGHEGELRCGAQRTRATIGAPLQGGSSSATEERLAQALIEELVARRCGPAQRAPVEP